MQWCEDRGNRGIGTDNIIICVVITGISVVRMFSRVSTTHLSQYMNLATCNMVCEN